MQDVEIDLSDAENRNTLLVRMVELGSSVLELGCGSGYLSAFLRDKFGCCVTAIEMDPQAVEVARGKGLDVVHA
jgi:protein-L-isoaspartate O-methyltransferase